AGGWGARLGGAGPRSAGRETAGPPARRQVPATATRLPDWHPLLWLEAGCALLRTGEVDSSRRGTDRRASAGGCASASGRASASAAGAARGDSRTARAQRPSQRVAESREEAEDMCTVIATDAATGYPTSM